jgi:hypothetical protein
MKTDKEIVKQALAETAIGLILGAAFIMLLVSFI